MDRFVTRFSDKITGILSGFDRLVFRGTLRQLAYEEGLRCFLGSQGILFKEFGAYAQGLTERLKEVSLAKAHRLGRPVEYLQSGGADKEAIARRIADRDGVRDGLIAVLTAVEPCRTYEVYRNRAEKRLQILPRIRKCLFLYHYYFHPMFGFMHARIQTWLPFAIQICLNGREWLARQLERRGIGFQRVDNALFGIEKLPRAQGLATGQLKTNWQRELDRLARTLNPAHDQMLGVPLPYYWSTYQSEWATDVMLKSAEVLKEIQPALIRHGITVFSSQDVMRFLGQKPHPNLKKEVVSSFRERQEGVRIKHFVGRNSVKLYDKPGNILRFETTIHDRKGFKAFRAPEGDVKGPKKWRPMRAGIADLYRRAEVSQATNDRYADALSAVAVSSPLQKIVGKVCRPVFLNGKRVRALRPWTAEDGQLLTAIARGEWAINGFRNRDLQAELFRGEARTERERRSRSAKVTRLLRLLRAHGLIQKVSKTHRYVLTVRGTEITSTLIKLQHVTLADLRMVA